MARTSAQRGVADRERRVCGLHASLVDIDRSLVIAAKVMTEAEFDGAEQRREILGNWIDELLRLRQTKPTRRGGRPRRPV